MTKKPQSEPKINLNYPRFQLAKALTTSTQHPDPATQNRAQQRVEKWTAVFKGILDGSLHIGSRTPVKDTPAWATLEVVTGGFATGNLLASGTLQSHERTLLTTIAPEVTESEARHSLNSHYLTDEGLASLQSLLHSGCYEINIPEEGALLAIAWLTENNHQEQARALLDELAPHFAKLRFYPIPTQQAQTFNNRIFLQDVNSIIRQLEATPQNPRILAQKEAIQVWLPLYDRAVALFLETVEGTIPDLERDVEGKPQPVQQGKFPVTGGWPCQYYPDDWVERAQEVLDIYHYLREQHSLCSKPERMKHSFAQLRHYLQQCITDPVALTGRDVGRIRLILARYVAKRGAPGSAQWRHVRGQQAQQANAPTHQAIAEVVVDRLQHYPPKQGIDNLAPIIQPITAVESEVWTIATNTAIPKSQQRKVQRCLSATLDTLVERGIVTSGETLARLLPQITAHIQASSILEPDLRRLYAALYQAFRRRRSLLLFNLASQVKFQELPWVAAIEQHQHSTLSAQDVARQSLEEVTLLTVMAFPHTLFPNPLIRELRMLAQSASLHLPLTEELAADIFMGAFTPTFIHAAKMAGDLLAGSLYATYYGIDYDKVRRLATGLGTSKHIDRRNTQAFLHYCATRAGVKPQMGRPAQNGMIIEQQQILTTQNLAALFTVLDLKDLLHDELEGLAQQCFTWVCRRQQMKINNWHGKLIMLKNTAYAWRQMMFFLALLPDAQVQHFLAWAEGELAEQQEAFQVRFAPAWRGLVNAAHGETLDGDTKRCFLGWGQGKHWLLQ